MNESEFVDDLHPKIWRACLLMETHQSEAPALFGILSDLDRHWGVDTKLTHLLMCAHWDQDPRPEAIWFEVKRYPGEAELWGLVAARSAPPIGYYWPQQHRWAAWWARRGIHTREHTHRHRQTHRHTQTNTHIRVAQRANGDRGYDVDHGGRCSMFIDSALCRLLLKKS